MKKVFLSLSICAMLASCGNSENTSTTTDDQSTAAKQSEVDTATNNIGTDRTTEPASGEFQKGAQLLTQSDCLSCHKEQEKLVGPAYKEVAQKYEASEKNYAYLAEKIISGGKGNWGEIPMTPHPTLSKEDATEMAKYILSIK